MKNRNIIKIGFAFPNALFMGIIFISTGLYFILMFVISESYQREITSVILGLFLFILGLIPISAIRKLKIDKEANTIKYYMDLLFLFRLGKSYKLDSFDTIITGEKSRIYATGGGFLYSAKSFNKMKETDIWIIKNDEIEKIKIQNAGNKKKVKLIINKLEALTNYHLHK